MRVGHIVKTPVGFCSKMRLEASEQFLNSFEQRSDPESDTVFKRTGWRQVGQEFGSWELTLQIQPK